MRSEARFSFPAGVAVDGAGNVYVIERGSPTVRKITPAGAVSTLAGAVGVSGSADGVGGEARFNFPTGIAVDSVGSIYVADANDNTLRKVTAAGVVTTLAGTAGMSGSANGAGSEARFMNPAGVAVDGAGNVYVADRSNSTIRKVTPAGVVTTLAGAAGMPGSTDGTGSAARFFYPAGVAVDSTGNVYVADADSTIRKVTPTGVVTTLAGTAGATGSWDGTGTAARFHEPASVAVDSAGNIYVTDRSNAIRKVTAGGVVTTLAGTAGLPGSADGTDTSARFAYPFGVAVDSAGIFYVADSGNSTIRKVTAEGVVTTVAGTAGRYGSRDGDPQGHPCRRRDDAGRHGWRDRRRERCGRRGALLLSCQGGG